MVWPSFSTNPGQLTFHVTDSFRGGSQASTSPSIWVEPSGARTMNEPPTFGSNATAKPKKYCRLNSAVVSACHTFSGVAAM